MQQVASYLRSSDRETVVIPHVAARSNAAAEAEPGTGETEENVVGRKEQDGVL